MIICKAPFPLHLTFGDTFPFPCTLALTCPTPSGILPYATLRRALEEMMTEESAAKASKRATIAVTRVSPRPIKSPIFITKFGSKQDLVDSCIASCHIPFYLSRQIDQKWRRPGSSLPHGSYIDGGFASIMPPLEGYIGVMPFLPHWIPPPLLRGIDRSTLLSPALTPSFPYHAPEAVYMAFFPCSGEVMTELYKWGREAGHAWADRREARHREQVQ